MNFAHEILVALAGFIDATAGGGGLITIPLLSFQVPPGAATVGTNKVLALTSAAVALWVYIQHHRFPWRDGLIFILGIGAGTMSGAATAPFLPPELFQWALLFLTPVLLVVILRKESLTPKAAAGDPKQTLPLRAAPWLALICGLLCGFYDGIFGPGGGTFMLLAVVWLLQWPIMKAIALSKLANSISAGGSLLVYSATGFVDWTIGLHYAVFIGAGAFIGAQITKRYTVKIIKPLLALVAGLLWFRMAQSLFF